MRTIRWQTAIDRVAIECESLERQVKQAAHVRTGTTEFKRACQTRVVTKEPAVSVVRVEVVVLRETLINLDFHGVVLADGLHRRESVVLGKLICQTETGITDDVSLTATGSRNADVFNSTVDILVG